MLSIFPKITIFVEGYLSDTLYVGYNIVYLASQHHVIVYYN